MSEIDSREAFDQMAADWAKDYDRAEGYERALRYIAGEDVAGMEPHQRPKSVALAALATFKGEEGLGGRRR